MRLALLHHDHRPQLAVRHGEHYLPLSALCPELPQDLPSLLALAPWPAITAALTHAALPGIPVADASFLPPVMPASKILCVGLNYADHAAEGKQDVPPYPVFFTRYPSSFVGHGQPMLRPKLSEKYDYEAELAVVIGTRCRHVPKEKALEVVAGYTLCNDGSLRDYQKRTPQWTLGKNFDASGALGPEIVLAPSLPPGAKGLRITSRLNGQLLQDDTTDHMLYDVATLIAALTEVMVLNPGDLISTGTPAGVGFARDPKLWMRPGDVIEVAVEGLGTLRNPIAAE